LIPEATFLFSIAGLSASLAGLAGLVVGLRRGSDLRPLDHFRLRQIVEFAFANVVLAVGIVPLVSITGSVESTVRIAAVVALTYAISSGLFLIRRARVEALTWTAGWVAGVIVLNVTMIATGAVAIATGSMGWYEATLVLLLARPMFAFLLVIESIHRAEQDSTA
jgi:hypothetical protein